MEKKKGFKIGIDTIIITIVMVTLLLIVIIKASDYTDGVNDCNDHWLKQLTPEQQSNPFIQPYIQNNSIELDRVVIK